METDEPVAMAEHECKTEGKEQDSAKASVDDTFHQHIDSLTGSAKACLQHGKTNLHPKHEECRKQCPNRIDGIDNGIRLERRAVCVCGTAEKGCINRDGGKEQRNGNAFAGKDGEAVTSPFGITKTLT
jgi:hypothetical protein